ncbi:hypothetical protein I317_01416 [Kwoniella heveanensis CBS 569]|nr:hypothetical protein I317_01416 [Kwoniella heveanensis CBS 569]
MAYVWLHKGAFGCAEDLVKGKKTTKFVDYAMHRVRLLRYHGITPFVVFDGGPLPAKKGTEVSRAKSRADNLERARSMESQGRWREARDFYTRCLDITPEMAYQLIKALRAENVEYVVAPYEADAQLCFLEREGYVDGIITEDSDLLVFGCRQVIFKLDGNGQCVWIHRDNLATIRDFPMHGWDAQQFRRMAMLSGCDYLESIPGIGLKTAHRLLRRFNTVEKLLQHVRMEGTLLVPPDYLEDFAQAELAFIHQRVYHPHQCRLVPLNDFPEGGLAVNDEKWIGLDVEEAVAKGMALGDLHPETRLPIVDEWPDFKPTARSKPFTESSKPNLPSGKGPMDAFVIKGVNKSKSLPTPVGRLSSGPSRLSDLQATRSTNILRRDTTQATTNSGSQSKWFRGSGRTKRELTPELPCKWEESEGEDIESQQTAGPSRRTPSTSPPVRSPSPDSVCSVQDESPTKSIFSEHHHVSSPGGPSVSSPIASPFRDQVPFDTPPSKKDKRVREQLTPTPSLTPTGATLGDSRRSELVASSSQALFRDDVSFVKIESQIPTTSSTPSASNLKTSIISRTDTDVSLFVACSSPGEVDRVQETQYPSQAPTARRKQPSTSSITSSDTVEDQEELVTPSLESYKKRKRNDRNVVDSNGHEQDDIKIDEEEEKEARNKQKARVIALGWRSKYALGQSSSSPVPIDIDDTPKRMHTLNKRTKSDPTPQTRRSTASTTTNKENIVTPRGASGKRPMMPLTATAPKDHILASRRINVPIPTSLPAKRSTAADNSDSMKTSSRKQETTPLFGKSRSTVGSRENSAIVPATSSPVSRCGSSGSSEIGEESQSDFSPLGTQPGGKTWSKLQKYRMGS